MEDLATASIDEVLHLWTGLGYYARGRNIHKAAKLIVEQYSGRFPEDQLQLEALPGIGPSTAGAIRAIAMQQRGVILDGNVKRVLARFHAITGHYSHSPSTNCSGSEQKNIRPLSVSMRTPRRSWIWAPRSACAANLIAWLAPLAGVAKPWLRTEFKSYPPRKKPAKPIRQARFFVLRLPDNRVLLEQRQQSGLWGGLWNPPERGVEVSIEEFLSQRGVIQQDVIATRGGERFRHTFSHFHLDIEPVYIDLRRQPQMLQETNQRWVAADRLKQHSIQSAEPLEETIGLSAAALKILAPKRLTPN